MAMKATYTYMGQSNSTVYCHPTPPPQYQLGPRMAASIFIISSSEGFIVIMF